MTVGPELDMTWSYGELRFIGLSSGQDLDDGDHAGHDSGVVAAPTTAS